MKNYGKLIALEGIDCAGKSNIIKGISKYLPKCKTDITVLGEFFSPLKDLTKKTLVENGSPFIKTYLFATDRAWTYENLCLPALEHGNIVFWDRYVDSALVYRKVELQKRKSIIDFDFVISINHPFVRADLTLYIDISTSTSLKRAKMSSRCGPYSLAFLNSVRKEYRKLINNNDFLLIDGEKDLDCVQREISLIIRNRFKDLFYEI